MDDPLCRIAGLEKQFGRNRVLRGLDLDPPRDRVTALTGANGAGKSTLVRILCGVHRRSGGRITRRAAPSTRPARPGRSGRAC